MIKNLFFAIISAMLLCSCDVGTKKKSVPLPNIGVVTDTAAVYHRITDEEARDMMMSEESFILLDVRTEEEYKEKRIAGAVLIPDYAITDRAETDLPDKNILILVYCRSGRRSENATKELVDMGYTNVYDFGGINDWEYETISE